MDESSCQISAIVFTLANSYGSHSAVFSRILWMFFMFQSNTVCLKKYWLIRVIAEYHHVNLLICFTVIGPLLFACQERKLYIGVQSGFSQGREGFLE